MHYKKKRVALTQLGLSQLQVHYPTMCMQLKQTFCSCSACTAKNGWVISTSIRLPQLQFCKLLFLILQLYMHMHICMHSKKKLPGLVALVAKVFVLSSAQMPVLEGVAQSLMVYYMRE